MIIDSYDSLCELIKVYKESENIVPNAHFMGLVPTLEYLAKGGRI